ncbi:hypothetical protein GCM10010149_88430 [Nonomuraea roseoviolacea subsp. roseoviolacea]|uniref:DUF7178 family protein n=1 Tax=Nonomuraea roseoviolacea TaxID=103837 RepID=UPI0031E44E47
MLISINPDPGTRAMYVANVIQAFESATLDQVERGQNWYRTAGQIALMIADGNLRMGAGVIAALSANKRWSENVRLASMAFGTGKPAGHFTDALDKAEQIMTGKDPAEVLPMHLKTGHFYRCIIDPSDPEPVCIDRHAHDIAVGQKYGNKPRGLGSIGRYDLVAGVYRDAAWHLGILPQVLQAVTWVAHIEAE